MHLLREGQFNVASTFISEANAHPPNFHGTPPKSWEFKSESLQRHFAEMYHILHELREERNLTPAIQWARKNSAILESRGSNLEFELCRLQYVRLFMGGDTPSPVSNPMDGTLRAAAYARSHFDPFRIRYDAEIKQLVGAMAYAQNISASPYAHVFLNGSAWDDVANSFNKEFCSLLGLSADSPLYVAATAGAIALPVLAKVKSKIKANGATWTTDQELPVRFFVFLLSPSLHSLLFLLSFPTSFLRLCSNPANNETKQFEVPLPPAYQFHSIFVCPVSKDQATDNNPPMMMPCGHVICKESLEKISKGARFKCPYCPSESNPSQARKVFL
jgi:hypothetical protein